ncbi:MAG TPA: nuclear transport factor 2 family protein [Pseudonocardia sp.]
MTDIGTQTAEATIAQWRSAGETGDAQRAIECLAADVQLVSPLTEQFRFRGRAQVGAVLAAGLGAISDIAYHTELHDPAKRTCALFYRARIGSTMLEESQLLRLDPAGLISELTLFVRPLPALTALMSALGPALARQDGRPGLAVGLAAATAPLHAATAMGDRFLVPRAAPRSTAGEAVD